MNTFKCIVKGKSQNGVTASMTIEVEADCGFDAVGSAVQEFKRFMGFDAKSSTCRMLKPKKKGKEVAS